METIGGTFDFHERAQIQLQVLLCIRYLHEILKYKGG